MTLFFLNILVSLLKGITHVLTATSRMKPMFKDKIHYMVLDFPDAADQNILDTFPEAHTFIESAIDQGGKVLIHWYVVFLCFSLFNIFF